MFRLIAEGVLALVSFGLGWYSCRKWGSQAAQVAQAVDQVTGTKL